MAQRKRPERSVVEARDRPERETQKLEHGNETKTVPVAPETALSFAPASRGGSQKRSSRVAGEKRRCMEDDHQTKRRQNAQHAPNAPKVSYPRSAA